MKKGDFFITNNVSSKGFTGHAAIYTGKGKVKEAPGYGQPVRVKSFSDWKKSTLKKEKEVPNIVISRFIEHQKNIEVKLEAMRNLFLTVYLTV